ncbi:MAG: serine--tRNA ligase [Bacteroidetes bacterium GWF2_42_66]|nr:MAG: serine--tRNA ligase [Bacteroidetes bacterium GWA2_42_15]OFY01846.1 MAG: serine--tRNA ligase [Bacteroidetes bacterium GWE2_42_39]OFY44859.1 MAG: serine--tRNA ligase [Bacteroidetes bacterium GWF2_42_66]HBL75986.1 serine--tRNA ligase [Prolixibacteraceae bacterium]HCR89968.1 serine--tRNA ligase [Prolixibacteraceae bacterium]
MLNLRFIQENPELVVEKLKKKNFNAQQIVDEIIALYKKKNEIQAKGDQVKSEMNRISKEIGNLMREGKKSEADVAKDKTAELKESIKQLDEEFAKIDDQVFALQVQLPNIPAEIVPVGKTPEDNLIVARKDEIPVLPEDKLPHWELAKKYDIIDFELGVKLTGAGFPVYKGKGSILQRALINFFLTEAGKAGYLEVQPPLMVNEDSGFGTGQLPDKEGQMYHVTLDNLYLIPTAEVPVTNIYRDVILEVKDFPVKNCAYSACFRREAGSYGKDVRGLNRLHQFDKVEIVQVALPETSYERLDEMVAHVAGLVEKLELPYRILRLCGGDMSFTSALTYDFEVYSAAQEKWLEVSSVSNFESFQANRLKLRYRDEITKKPQIAHTLNGSALALPRIVAALLENNQTPEGIRIPKVLVPFCGFEMIN